MTTKAFTNFWATNETEWIPNAALVRAYFSHIPKAWYPHWFTPTYLPQDSSVLVNTLGPFSSTLPPFTHTLQPFDNTLHPKPCSFAL